MYIIEKVTKILFPNDCIHEPYRPKKLKASSSGGASSSRAAPPRAPSSHSHGGGGGSRARGSRVKSVLRAIFNICKYNAMEVNEMWREVKEVKEHLQLPTSPHRELPDFDDPFAEWDAAEEEEEEEAPPAPRSRRTLFSCGEIEEEEEEEYEE